MKLLAIIFKNKENTLTFGLSFLRLFLFLYSVPMWANLYTLYSSELIPFSHKFGIASSVFTNPLQYHHLFDIFMIGMVALIAALNVVLVQHINSISPKTASKKSSIVWLTVAFLGTGCAACGSIFLPVVLLWLGLGGLLTLLPLAGAELLYIAFVALFVNVYFLYKRSTRPLVCNIDQT